MVVTDDTTLSLFELSNLNFSVMDVSRISQLSGKLLIFRLYNWYKQTYTHIHTLLFIQK